MVRFFLLWHFGFKLPIESRPLLEDFGACFPKWHRLSFKSIKRHLPAWKLETCCLSHKTWKSVPRFDLGAWSRKKDSTGQPKSHKGVIFHLLGEKPQLNRFSPKFAQWRVAITCAKLGTEIFRGYGLQGLEFFIYLLMLAWALQQCSANGLPLHFIVHYYM